MSLNIEEKDGIYFVSGRIEEGFSFDKNKIPSGKVYFNLSGIKSFNSIGIRDWLEGLTRLNISPIYKECPHSFVLMLGMLRELYANSFIESFQIPAFCPTCGENKVFLARSGHDFFPGKRFEYQLPKCEKDQSQLEFEGDYESDYYFVEELVG